MNTLPTLPIVIMLFVTSCGPNPVANPATSTPVLPADDTPAPATATPAAGGAAALPAVTPLPMDMLPHEAETMLARVQQDLAQRLSAPPGATMTLLSAEAVTWPDASLGCPRPNTGYIQVETPGFVITLLANGGRYTYHTDLADNYVLCMMGEPGDPKTEDGNVQDGWPNQTRDKDVVTPPTLTPHP